jgi:hypothetical protein
MRHTIYSSPSYVLEVDAHPARRGIATVDFLVTIPAPFVQHPRTELAYQLNLPTDAIARLGKVISELGGSE